MVRRRKPDEGRSSWRKVAFAGGVLAAALLVWGGYLGWRELDRICRETTRIADLETDVSIVSGKMVAPEIITMHFGLTNGASLADIDFSGLRAKLMDKVPNIRDVRISRRLPNRVSVEVIEREPIARLMSQSQRSAAGRVVDSEGVVFRYSRDVDMLPIIRESKTAQTKPGERLKGLSAAALRLVEMVAEKPFSSLGIQEVDSSRTDYLVATMGDYSQARIAWNKMGEDSRAARESLRGQLERLTNSIATQMVPGARLWIATDWKLKRIYAKDPTRAGLPAERNAQ